MHASACCFLSSLFFHSQTAAWLVNIFSADVLCGSIFSNLLCSMSPLQKLRPSPHSVLPNMQPQPLLGQSTKLETIMSRFVPVDSRATDNPCSRRRVSAWLSRSAVSDLCCGLNLINNLKLEAIIESSYLAVKFDVFWCMNGYDTYYPGQKKKNGHLDYA